MKKVVLIALTTVGAAMATSQAQAGISFNIFGGSSRHDDHHAHGRPVIVAPRQHEHARPSYGHQDYIHHDSHAPVYHRPSHGHGHVDNNRHERRNIHGDSHDSGRGHDNHRSH